MITSPINYVCLDDRGVAFVAGTRIKVRHIAVERTVRDSTPEEIREAYPHLSLAQIHAALAYYYDHKAQIDEEIVEAYHFAEDLRRQNPNPLTREEFGARDAIGHDTATS